MGSASNTEKSWLSIIDLRKTTFFFALLSWVLLLSLGIAEQSMTQSALPFKNQVALKGLLLNALIFNVYVFHWLQAKEQPIGNFYDRLWKAFIMGLLTALGSLLLNMLATWSESSPTAFKLLVHTFIFHVEFILLLWFLLHVFAQWKSAILYARSTFALHAWNTFEVLLFVSAIAHFFDFGLFDRVVYLIYGGGLLLSLLLCLNLRWLPRLTYRQRLYGLFMFLGILGSMAYFTQSMTAHFSNEPLVVDDISKSMFMGALFTFDAGYAIIALLFTLFNLPTASAFEEKFKEMADFQRLNDRMQGRNRKEIYQQLLKSALDTTDADAGWLEAPSDQLFIRDKVTEEEAIKYQELLKEQGYNSRGFVQYKSNYFLSAVNRKEEFRSALAIPIKSNMTTMGTLVLLKKRGNAFDTSMVTMANTFATQAGIALHNRYLLDRSLGDAQFRKGLAVARNVQARLLPPNFDNPDTLAFHGISHSEDGIGGDYYDYYQLSSSKYAVLIADVAGKGIGAAFTMAQVKGVFQALAPLNLMPNEFLKQANAALSGCLEKGVFVTATYYYIETREQKIYYARAGHCPTLYYDRLHEKAHYFENNGLGLGIITSEAYDNFIEMQDMIYASGDLLMLYTDGIVEATNTETQEEYGYERLKAYLEEHKDESLEQLSLGVVQDVQRFVQADRINDDYTVVLLKMK